MLSTVWCDHHRYEDRDAYGQKSFSHVTAEVSWGGVLSYMIRPERGKQNPPLPNMTDKGENPWICCDFCCDSALF
jgi:hypothetical protein